jgi:outer membrane protein, heavy metal efflux system
MPIQRKGAASLLFPLLFCVLILMGAKAVAADQTLKLADLIREATKNNPEIDVSAARAKASEHRIPQSTSLADPMFMLGYENEGTDNLYSFGGQTKGMPADSRWMFSFSQMLPYPGKLALKGEMAARDAESLKDMVDFVRLNTIVRVKELYCDLFLAYTSIDLLRDKAVLFTRTEDAALARYASGMAPQQEVLMAQTEKYMLLEKEEMFKQKIQSTEAMLNAVLGRKTNSPLGGRPEKPSFAPYSYSIDELIRMSYEKYPVIKSREKMVSAAQAKVEMAKKEFYPDFTVGANYIARDSRYPDMWSLTTAVNIPLYYKKKQEQGVLEAEAALLEAKKEVEALKLMTASVLRDNFAMVKTADELMALYQDGLIPKAYQDFELALAGYVTGKVEAITVVSRLKPVIDNEMLYWEQFVQRAKAVARIEGIVASGHEGVAK